MYDVLDILRASRCSADVLNHVLRVYGEGNMGNGVRKLAGEMITVGYQNGYVKGYQNGVVTSILGVGVAGAICLGILCSKAIKEQHNFKKGKS